jgi:hypothetical protein
MGSDLTKLGVVAAEGDELFADGAAAVRFSLARLSVRHNTLHLENKNNIK